MAAFAATGVVLSATYMLWMFQRVNYGPVSNEKNAALMDLAPREWFVLVPIIAATVLMGVLPNLFLRSIEPSAARVVSQVRAQAPARIQARADQSAVGSQQSAVSSRQSSVGSRQSPVSSPEPLAPGSEPPASSHRND